LVLLGVFEMIPFPNKKYQIIYADPPWSYSDTQESGGTAYFGASVRYKTLSNKDICNLLVGNIADKNCVLFIWVTNPLLPEALEVVNAWGFKFKTVAFCWNKISKNGHWVSNMGRWTMGNIEVCLLATKGHPKRIAKNIKQLIINVRSSHSKKPSVARDRIVQLMGDLPRIELFARPPKDRLFKDESYKGWDLWGNEV